MRSKKYCDTGIFVRALSEIYLFQEQQLLFPASNAVVPSAAAATATATAAA
ncbi:hypothetical protein, conserved, partial [Eimeria tenella]